MNVLGVVEDISHEGLIIVRGEVTPEYGNIVCDPKGKKIGTVKRIFGPVKEPYISVVPADRSVLKGIEGKKVYFEEGTQYGKNKRRN
ncbi:MAG: Gar1/Naf1 family protein [Methanomassiliicoccaceae archaeon]|nr:Gar1/Naf1 family protein [Methanomassiliicoccaceae archaeon]